MIYLTDRLYSGLNLNLAQIAVSTGPLDKEGGGGGGCERGGGGAGPQPGLGLVAGGFCVRLTALV